MLGLKTARGTARIEIACRDTSKFEEVLLRQEPCIRCDRYENCRCRRNDAGGNHRPSQTDGTVVFVVIRCRAVGCSLYEACAGNILRIARQFMARMHVSERKSEIEEQRNERKSIAKPDVPL